MPASIVFNQTGAPAGVAGKARSDFVTGQIVHCTNSPTLGVTSYAWELVDVPIRSALVRGATSTAADFQFTPDVKGTYLVSLTINGSPFATDTARSFCAILSSGTNTLGWRYKAAGETEEDNMAYTGLGFPSNVNPRGWATDEDLVDEQIESAVYKVQNAVVTSPGPGTAPLVKLDTATGKFDATVIPSIGGTVFAGDAGAGGTQGEVPAPVAGDYALHKYLSAGGTWAVINQDQISPGFSIASFTKTAPNPGTLTYRRGDTLTGITAAATYVSGPPTSGSISNTLGGSVGGTDVNPTAWTFSSPYASATQPTNVKREGSDLGADPTWTIGLSATGTAVDTENIVVTWTRDVYYGVGAAGLNTEAAIEGLAANALSSSRARTITVSPSSEKVYYAFPKQYGTATFTLNGFPAAFNTPLELAITNVNGVTSTYYVYESTNLLSGTSLAFVVT
jgi:hypothetical protein